MQNLFPGFLEEMCLSAIALVLLPHLSRRQVRVRVKRRTGPLWLARSVGTLSAMVAIASPAGAGQRKDDRPLRPLHTGPVQPWIGTGGPLPPLPPVPAQAPLADPPSPARRLGSPLAQDVSRGIEGASNNSKVEPETSRHEPIPRAVHPQRSVGHPVRLFPKAGDEAVARRACMGRHPSALKMQRTSRYEVRPGDTLWGIAAEVLGTDSPARIARYWPKIHRQNRREIGGDPSVIIPGTVLELPAEEASS